MPFLSPAFPHLNLFKIDFPISSQIKDCLQLSKKAWIFFKIFSFIGDDVKQIKIKSQDSMQHRHRHRWWHNFLEKLFFFSRHFQHHKLANESGFSWTRNNQIFGFPSITKSKDFQNLISSNKNQKQIYFYYFVE